ncbi:helix-turn-helix domain-containing protein [Chryseobacterium sp. A301]
MAQIYIKNMVCDRCILVVQGELEKLGLEAKEVKLGEAELLRELSPDQRKALDASLKPLGFEIIDDKKKQLIEGIKTIIIELVHTKDNENKTNLSTLLSEQLNHDYSYLSNLFSELEKTTIEKYFIAQKIEKVKELLVYDELTLSEIADQLNYSSVAYLSNQFKKITGFSPSEFKKEKTNQRKSLDSI